MSKLVLVRVSYFLFINFLTSSILSCECIIRKLAREEMWTEVLLPVQINLYALLLCTPPSFGGKTVKVKCTVCHKQLLSVQTVY